MTTSAVNGGGRVEGANVRIGAGVVVEAGAELEGDSVTLHDGAFVGRDTTIRARRIEIGRRTRVQHDSTFAAIGGGQADEFALGDCGFIGFGQVVAVPVLRTGDYTVLHNSMLVNGYEPCTIGHNCWIGQHTILNATARLTIGNNVRIGTQSQVWTHVASGELLEGCRIFGADPVVLEDDVWLVGGAVVSPNLVVARRTVVMTGSVLTKSTEPGHCYAGVPAKDITDKLVPWSDVSLDEKFDMMRGFIAEFHESTQNAFRDRVYLERDAGDLSRFAAEEATVVVTADVDVTTAPQNVSAFDLRSKLYSKRSTPVEESFIRFNVGHRARFLPAPA